MELKRKFPDLTSANLDPKIDRELISTFNRVYDYIDSRVADIKRELEAKVSTQESRTQEFGALLGNFATQLIGDQTSNPLDVLSTDSSTVTSVGATGNAGFNAIVSITGSPVTGSGSIGFNLANQNANRILAGPISGAAAVPSFRLLISSDMPRTSSAADPTVTELPNSGDSCVHKNTVSGNVFLAYNNAGAIVKVQLV